MELVNNTNVIAFEKTTTYEEALKKHLKALKKTANDAIVEDMLVIAYSPDSDDVIYTNLFDSNLFTILGLLEYVKAHISNEYLTGGEE